MGYETETQVVTRTIYKSTSGYVSPTSSGASYYTSTVTINGMQYTMCVAPKLLSKNTTDVLLVLVKTRPALPLLSVPPPLQLLAAYRRPL